MFMNSNIFKGSVLTLAVFAGNICGDAYGTDLKKDDLKSGIVVKMINIKDDDKDLYKHLATVRDINKGNSLDSETQRFALLAVKKAAEKSGIKGDIIPVDLKDQGWNGVAFKVHDKKTGKTHCIKLARGADETKDFKRIKRMMDGLNYEDKGLNIPVVSHVYKLSVNKKELPQGEKGLNSFTVQVMNFLEKDGDILPVAKRLLTDSEYNKRNVDLRLVRFFAQSLGRFQRGGKAHDKENKTIIHGDLFTGHIFVNNYKFGGDIQYEAINPDFSLVDVATMKQVQDPDSNMLLVDPMYLSSVLFFQYRAKNFEKGMLEMFNNFYTGYLKEFSDATLDRLAKLYETRESAYKAFKVAAKYQEEIVSGGGKKMKTSQFALRFEDKKFKSADEQNELEKNLSNLHRLTFLKSYYAYKGDKKRESEIEGKQKSWNVNILK
jgi:hypothetical protein